MMSVIDFFSQPGWQRLGFVLLHFLWQGVVVALLTAGLIGLFRLRRGVARYQAYLLGFAIMALCPVATYLLLETPRANIAATTDADPAVTFAPPPQPVRLETPVTEPPKLTASREWAETTHASFQTPTSSDPTPRTDIVQNLRDKIVEVGRRAVPWSLVVWLTGVVILGGRMLIGVVGSYRWRRRLLPLPDESRRRAAALGERFGAAVSDRIWLSRSAIQPMVVGYLKPLVLLPASLAAGMPPELLEAVIAHELAHVRRFDPLVNLVQRIVETLLFYHPALWWLSRRVRAEREICCDELAVQHTGDPVVYASALERAGRMRLATARPVPALGLLNGRRPLLARIRLILGTAGDIERKPASSWPAGLLAVAMVVAVAAAIEFTSPVEAAPMDEKRLFGRVVNDKGEPVPGVEVSVWTADEHALRQALAIHVRTDQQGRFDATAPFAGVRYFVMARGRGGGRIPVFTPGTGEEIVLTLEPYEPHELSGIARTESGEPVADATVVLVGEYAFSTKARTDAQGRYRIVVAGRLGQGVMHAETTKLISPYQRVLDSHRSVDFMLGPPAGLTGLVKDQLTGKPVDGCVLTLKPRFSCGFARTATTDGAGRFSIVHLPPGEYEARAASDTHYEPPTRGDFLERPKVPLTSGRRSFHEIKLRPMTTIVGRALRHNGQPAAGAFAGVRAYWNMDSKNQYLRTQADAEGRFLIRTGRLNETLDIISQCGGFARVKLTGAVEGETLDLGDVQLSGTIRIRGTVSDPNGKPVAGVRVTCAAGPGGSGDAVTDDDGRFDLGRLALGADQADSVPVKILVPRHRTPGVIALFPLEDTPQPKPNTRYFHSQELKLKATPGKEFELNVTLELAEPLAFRGRVVDPAGKPVPKARIVCFAGDARKTWYRRFMPDLNISGHDPSFHSFVQIGVATSDTDGKWIIRTVRENADDLRLGHYASQPDTSRYSIGVIGPDHQTKLIRDVTLEEHAVPKSIEIVLPEHASSSISGRVVDTEGQPLAGVTVGLGHMFGVNMPISGVEPAVTGDDGRFRIPVDESTNAAFLRIAAEGWSIQSPKPDSSGRGLRLSREGGGFSDLTVVMAQNGVVTGSVRWSSGEPVVDYEVRGYSESPGLIVPKQRITGGEVEFALRAFPPGDGTIRISTPSGVEVQRRVQVAPRGSTRVDIVLPLPTCVIRGRLVDANGKPAAGSHVVIAVSGDGRFHFHREAIPNATGGFEFKAPAGVYNLLARPVDRGPPRTPVPRTKVTVVDGQAETEVVLTFPAEVLSDLIVEVLDKGGQPLPGVTVRSGGFGPVGNAPTGETDAAGRFLVKGIKAGKHYIVLTDPKRMLNENMRLSVPIEAGKTVTHRIVLDAGRRVRGRVTCDGQPVSNAHVMTTIETQNRYSSNHTGEDGVFQLLNVPDGELTIRCYSYLSNQTVTKTFSIVGDRDDVEFKLPTGRITGKILDRHGRLLKGRFIKLDQLRTYGNTAKASHAPTHLCEDGLINLPHLGNGQYRLTLQDDYTSNAAAVLAVSDPVEIRNGKPVEDFVIRER
jgi:beta-lactamase regulating signal transducer with metallopeptidase domain/protocatechuate 3,4-dioxygenase beta subunit